MAFSKDFLKIKSMKTPCVEHLYYLFGKKLFANHALVPAIMISLFLPKKLLLKQNCGKVKNTTNLEYQNYTAIL